MTPANRFDEARFGREAGLLVLFGGGAVLVLRPALTATWVGAGAIVGAVYWTLMYHETLAGLQSKLPGGDRVNAIWSFLVLAVVLEFVGDSGTVKGGLVLGFVAGFVCAGAVAAARTRLVARVLRETE